MRGVLYFIKQEALGTRSLHNEKLPIQRRLF